MARVDEGTPLCLLLLDGTLEEVAFGARAAELNRSPNVVVVEPARRPTPALLAPRVARRLVKRLPGVPRVIVLVGEAQRTLAVALQATHPDSELLVVAGEDEDVWPRLEAAGIRR